MQAVLILSFFLLLNFKWSKCIYISVFLLVSVSCGFGPNELFHFLHFSLCVYIHLCMCTCVVYVWAWMHMETKGPMTSVLLSLFFFFWTGSLTEHRSH